MEWIKRRTASTIEDVIESNIHDDIKVLNENFNTPVKNLDVVARRLKEIAELNKTVTVFADYDCDGVCSAVILNLILTALKIKFSCMFPKRCTGYGINVNDVEKIDSDVIITVDNGIAALEAIKAAKNKGIEVIVLDHHLESSNGLPNADIIVDPHVFKNNESDFEDWCGAGLCYELCKELGLQNSYQKIAVQFAAIATVADVVPLLGDNRCILKEGLALMQKSFVTSIRTLVDMISGTVPYVDVHTIGFKIAPIINSVSRVEDDIDYVYRYFLSGNHDMAEHMIEVNETRKTLVAEATQRAERIIAGECLFSDVPIVIYDPETIEGIVGIVAGKISEEYNVPVICLTDSMTKGVCKGSARSVDDINIKETLDKASDLLLHYGGHPGAAGLSLKAENIELLRERFSKMFSDYEPSKSTSEMFYDLEINAEDIPDTIEKLKKYAPFGQGNPEVVFKITNFKLFPRNGSTYKFMGNDNSALKLFGNKCSAIGFGMVEQYNKTGLARNLEMVGTLSENHFTSVAEPQVEIKDLKKIEVVQKKSDLANKLAERLKLM